MALWSFIPGVKVPRMELEVMKRLRCPYCESGHLNRLAERGGSPKWQWHPIGYRCSSCGICAIDTKVEAW